VQLQTPLPLHTAQTTVYIRNNDAEIQAIFTH